MEIILIFVCFWMVDLLGQMDHAVPIFFLCLFVQSDRPMIFPKNECLTDRQSVLTKPKPDSACWFEKCQTSRPVILTESDVVYIVSYHLGDDKGEKLTQPCKVCSGVICKNLIDYNKSKEIELQTIKGRTRRTS